ncbi:MAG TPA: DNA alkylation repair protein [Patescibacteria group bacterium]|nr:DNA alkylation repair protein [Patescibacteria group bacterium]
MAKIVDQVLAELDKYASPADAEFLQRFFKTGEGQYGAGDVFIGVRVPNTRRVARQFKDLSLPEIEALLDSPVHEMRLCAVIIMTEQAKRANESQSRELLDLYLHRTDRINNWDIVDLSCRDVVGEYVLKHPEQEKLLRKLASSKDIWERRIAIVSTWQLIRAGRLDMTFEISRQLLSDKHDLVQKAVGWMLREAGKRDARRLRRFLTDNIKHIPRTTLRYAIERFEPEERQAFLKFKPSPS